MSLNAVKNLFNLAEHGGKGELIFSPYHENSLNIDDLMDILSELKNRGFNTTEWVKIDLREKEINLHFNFPLAKSK